MEFKSTKEFTKELSKYSDSEDVEIIIYPKKRGITEQTWSQGTWNGIKYTVKADVVQKGAVMGYEDGLDNFLEILSDYDITELNGDNFSGLTLLESAGGEIEVVEVDWEKKLNKEELKELEKYGGELQLFEEGDWSVEDVVFDNGDIIEIEVKINDSKYTLSKAEINAESKKHYHKNGKLKKIENFKDDKLDGLVTEYYESGILWYTAEYKNGLQDGKIVSYDEEGNKAKESHLVKGEYEGSQTEWWPSGEIKAKREYKDGKVISEETFTENNSSDNPINVISKHNLSKDDFSKGYGYVALIFEELKGIKINDIKIVPHEYNYLERKFFKTADEEVKSKWNFGIFNFAVIFKSFSKDEFQDQLLELLKENNIEYKSKKSNKFCDYWEGDGFKIETPIIKNYKIILISNENVFNSERIVISLRENKTYDDTIIDGNLTINPNNIFFIKENQTIAKTFNVQLEDLKDIEPPKKTNSQLLVEFLRFKIKPFTKEQLIEGLSLVENSFFKNLKGFNFQKLKVVKPEDAKDAQTLFTSDVDGDWKYTTMNFAMLFKAFSKEKFQTELDNLLRENNIDKADLVEENNYKYWAGNGFKIETPNIQNANVIIISNENLTRPDATKFKSTDKSDINKVYWVKGLDKIYNGKKALKNTSNIIEDYYNVPLYFDEEKESNEFILIPNQNLVPSKILIDKIIENNGGKDKFKFVGDVEDDWKYAHEGEDFLIGYLSKSYCIRLNKLEKPKFSNDIEEFEYNLLKLKLPENTDPASWVNILNKRAEGRKLFIETLKQTYWELSTGHTEEYVAKYKDGRLSVEDIYYRIDVYNVFIKEYERFFKNYQDLDKLIPSEIENKFFALIESLIGAEYTLIVMKEGGESIDENRIYKRVKRPNQSTVDDNNESWKTGVFVDKDEFTYYNGYLFNGISVTTANEKKYETLFRFGLKHGIEKVFDKEGKIIEERIYFNDKYVGNNEGKVIKEDKKKEIIKAFSDFEDKEKRKIQLSAFVKCVFELISADGKITDEEKTAFEDFLKEIRKEFPDALDEDSDEYKFITAGRENIIEAIQSFEKDEKDFFFETLINFALSDGELALEEANLIGDIASEIYPDLDSKEKLHEWFLELIKKRNEDNSIANEKGTFKSKEKSNNGIKILVLIIILISIVFIFYINRWEDEPNKPVIDKTKEENFEKKKPKLNITTDNPIILEKVYSASIIIGSFGSKTNAVKQRDILLKEGFKDIDISKVGKVHRVSVNVNGTKEKVIEVHNKVKVFHKDAWVSYKNN